ncbi:hypothetical protein SCUP234_11396 [Seiridium cupressi]
MITIFFFLISEYISGKIAVADIMSMGIFQSGIKAQEYPACSVEALDLWYRKVRHDPEDEFLGESTERVAVLAKERRGDKRIHLCDDGFGVRIRKATTLAESHPLERPWHRGARHVGKHQSFWGSQLSLE